MADDAGHIGKRVREIGVTEFKAKSLGLINDVEKGRLDQVVLTKRGRPVARLSRPDDSSAATNPDGPLFGCMKGLISVPADLDLTAPTTTEEEWEEQFESMSAFLRET